MKKFVLSTAVILSFGIYVFSVRYNDILAGISSYDDTPAPVLNMSQPLSQNAVSSLSSSSQKVSRNTNCVYIKSSSGDEEGGHYRCTTTIVNVPTTKNSTTTTTKPATTPVKNTTPTPAPVAMKPKPMMMSGWKDGTFIGDSTDAYYGNVQVSATISNGKLTNIAFLDYPKDRSTSLYKSQYAMPQLKSEAISAQSANVNTISGATATSEAFMQSLASALNQAKV